MASSNRPNCRKARPRLFSARPSPCRSPVSRYMAATSWWAVMASPNRRTSARARPRLRGLVGGKRGSAYWPDGDCPLDEEAAPNWLTILDSGLAPRRDLQARPVCHRSRDSIEAHLTIVSALLVSRWIEHQTGWSIRKFVKTARRYRTVQIQAGPHTITAADPLADDLRQVLEPINRASRPVH